MRGHVFPIEIREVLFKKKIITTILLLELFHPVIPGADDRCSKGKVFQELDRCLFIKRFLVRNIINTETGTPNICSNFLVRDWSGKPDI